MIHMKELARSYFWPGLDGQIEETAKTCSSCQRVSTVMSVHHNWLHSICGTGLKNPGDAFMLISCWMTRGVHEEFHHNREHHLKTKYSNWNIQLVWVSCATKWQRTSDHHPRIWKVPWSERGTTYLFCSIPSIHKWISRKIWVEHETCSEGFTRTRLSPSEAEKFPAV